MAKVMLVNVFNEEESRIAITSDGLLEELAIETASHEQIEGNLYKAKIVKILASLEAVFVDYGASRNGFLAFSDIHPKYFGEGQRGAEGLRKGQELLVQVRKGELGQKGAALTTYVSIPGRYIVLMPLVSKRGVSRKIQDDDIRKELKEVLEGSGIPEDMGYIVRTAGLDQTKQDMARDVSYLLRLWKNIQAQYVKAKPGSLLYQESDVVIRTIRDYFAPTIQEVWVDNAAIFEQVRDFFRAVMPWYQKKLRLYTDKEPLFSKFRLEHQIASIYEKTVPLPSGGSIVIEQTEALVSVDVNSGKTNKGRDIEETALIANREAAEEAARQLRLRDLGGLIVIDFIDMRGSAHRNEVRKALQKALKDDKARTDIGTISKFGMLELSRQRVKPAGLRLASTCPICSGTGRIRSAESVALAVLRLIQSDLTSGRRSSQVLVGLSTEVAVLLLNRKRKSILELEEDFGTTISICAEPALHANQYYLEFRENGGSRVETNLPEDFPRAVLKAPAGLPGVVPRAPRQTAAYALLADGEEDVAEPPEESAAAEEADAEAQPAEGPERTGKKRRRKRKKKKSGAEPAAAQPEAGGAPQAAPAALEPLEALLPALSEAESVPAPSAQASSAPEAGEVKRLSPSAKRRARRRRKKAPSGAPARDEAAPAAEGAEEPVVGAPGEVSAPASAPRPVEKPSPAPAGAAATGEEGSPKVEKPARRKRRPSKPKKAETPPPEVAPEEVPAAEKPAPAPTPAEGHPEEAAGRPAEEALAETEGARPKRKRRPSQRRPSQRRRAPKASAEPEPSAEGPAGEHPEG